MARDQFQTLTEPMYFTLLALGEVRNGAEITSWVAEITKGRIKLAPGTLYVLLAQFLENDLIKRVEVDKKGKHYILTEEGRKLLEEEVGRLRLLISNYEDNFNKWNIDIKLRPVKICIFYGPYFIILYSARFYIIMGTNKLRKQILGGDNGKKAR